MDSLSKSGFSIIVCTRNRASLLSDCLESFITQTSCPENVEFIVVDNNSSDTTKEVTLSFRSRFPRLRYILEETIGLSAARNRGMHESAYDWVCFMDDDALAHKDFIERMFFIKNNFSFDAFGGMFYPWHRTQKPKWLSEEFGKMPLLRKDIGTLDNTLFVAGGICAFNKEKAMKAGGFPLDIGMRGDIVGYGEENYLQTKMRENGDTIGFDPDWKIDHLVAPYKYTVSWQLQRHFGKGRDKQISKGKPISFLNKCGLMARALLSALFSLLKNLPRLFRKNYFLQNYIIDSLSYFYRVWGSVSV